MVAGVEAVTADRLVVVLLNLFDKHLARSVSSRRPSLDFGHVVLEGPLVAEKETLTWEERDTPVCEQISLPLHCGYPRPVDDESRGLGAVE